jgi:large subunit ribosomal protein L23
MEFLKKTEEAKKTTAAAKPSKRGPVTLADETLAANILRGARTTEKSYVLNALGQYVFTVAGDATKPEVRRAVETAYGVSVLSVNVSRLPGKKKGFGSRRGMTKSVKKAIVTLPKGTELELFKGI